MSDNTHWLRQARTIKKLWVISYCVLIVSVALELFIDHKPHFGIDGSFAFSAWFGFLSCLIMVLVAKFLGFILKRPDDYYRD